jgi:hypothetical protein
MSGTAERSENTMKLRISTLISLAILTTACGHGAAPEPPKRTPAVGTAQLPESPNLDPVEAPLNYPDGALSVRGLLAADKGSLAKEVSVRGYVAAMTPCAATETACKPAPHLYLSDQADRLGKRLLVGGERHLETRGLTVGQQVTLKGHFATSSDDGIYFAPGGLLLLTPVEPAPTAPDAH